MRPDGVERRLDHVTGKTRSLSNPSSISLNPTRNIELAQPVAEFLLPPNTRPSTPQHRPRKSWVNGNPDIPDVPDCNLNATCAPISWARERLSAFCRPAAGRYCALPLARPRELVRHPLSWTNIKEYVNCVHGRSDWHHRGHSGLTYAKCGLCLVVPMAALGLPD